MTLPIVLSVPHAGFRVPDEVHDICMLSPEEIARDGDEGAAEIYLPLKEHVMALVSTDVARAIVDMNRFEHDRRRDGIVKTHTCWDVQVYSTPLSEERIEKLIAAYHHTYHRRLTVLSKGAMLGVDCHTMASHGPPVGPDPGRERPAVCLSNFGTTCSTETLLRLAESLEQAFGKSVSINDPFQGGYIIRRHARETPWVQLELSRAPFMSHSEKSRCVLKALRHWHNQALGRRHADGLLRSS